MEIYKNPVLASLWQFPLLLKVLQEKNFTLVISRENTFSISSSISSFNPKKDPFTSFYGKTKEEMEIILFSHILKASMTKIIEGGEIQTLNNKTVYVEGDLLLSGNSFDSPRKCKILSRHVLTDDFNNLFSVLLVDFPFYNYNNSLNIYFDYTDFVNNSGFGFIEYSKMLKLVTNFNDKLAESNDSVDFILNEMKSLLDSCFSVAFCSSTSSPNICRLVEK